MGPYSWYSAFLLKSEVLGAGDLRASCSLTCGFALTKVIPAPSPLPALAQQFLNTQHSGPRPEAAGGCMSQQEPGGARVHADSEVGEKARRRPAGQVSWSQFQTPAPLPDFLSLFPH